jgi:hypothetical protein
MAALADFKAFLVAEAAKLGNSFDSLNVLQKIDSWYSVSQSLDGLRGTTTQGYTLNGRSVTRQAIESLKRDRAELQRDIEDLLYMRSVALVDNSGADPMSWPSVAD